MGDIEMLIEKITESGTDYRDRLHGFTPLINLVRLACIPLVEDHVKKMLKTNVDVNESDNKWNTALGHAVSLAGTTSSIGCVRALLAHPNIAVNPNMPQDCFLPLHVAITFPTSSFEAFSALLAHPGINPNKPTKDGLSPLMMALSRTDGFPYVEALLKHRRICINDKPNNNTALGHLLLNVEESPEFYKCLKALLADKNIDVNMTNQGGLPALAIAATAGFEKTTAVELLVDVPHVCFRIPLEQTITRGFSDMTALIILRICEKLKTNKLKVLRLPKLKTLTSLLAASLKVAILHTTRLKGLACHDNFFIDRIDRNFSIVTFGKAGDKSFDIMLDRVGKRNQEALEKCRKAALCTVFVMKILLSQRDVARLLGQAVWETRGTKYWIY